MQKNIFYPKNAIRLCLANQKQEHFDGILYSCVRKEELLTQRNDIYVLIN